MFRFAVTIFLSAFLLFQVQPIIARYILPWYGGTSMVWTTCLLFFQVFLLVGYAYAHLLRSFFSAKYQVAIHVILLIVALFFLPITPDAALKPNGLTKPLPDICYLLITTIGVPYGLVSASGPLLQYWFKEIWPGSTPYRLYALSNIGSLLALLSYPFFIEPSINLQSQTWTWSIMFIVFVVFCCSCLWSYFVANISIADAVPARQTKTPAPERLDRALWVLLSASASVLLLATSNQLTQDIAAFPFLWLLPLSLYLLSFILCFDRASWYRRRFWIPLFILFLLLGVYAFILNGKTSIVLQIFAYTGVLFTGCMICHGEMVRIKPHPDYLTAFYLLIATGGALGGIFVTLIAPLLFEGYWELQLIWCVILILTGVCLFRKKITNSYWNNIVLQTGWVGFCGSLIIIILSQISVWEDDVIAVTRNFYGVLRVKETRDVENEFQRELSLMHGAILHGSQRINDQVTRHWPTTYYGWDSGIGVAIDKHPRYYFAEENNGDFHVGVVGMGVATIAALCQRGDRIRFYDINSSVAEYALKYFSFLEDTQAEWHLVMGDARIAMEQEILAGNIQDFDVLAVDAFSGDAIPVHLLVIESFKIYWQHLKPDGILAIHISNRYLDLYPVVKKAAQYLNKELIVIRNADQPEMSTRKATWVLMTDNQEFLGQEDVILHTVADMTERDVDLWTDDYSNLLSVLR